MPLMLMQRDATVCMCHAKTRDPAQFTILADVLVVAAGHPNLILPQMVKTGLTVIDAGIAQLPDARLVGDAEIEGVHRKASYITLVLGWRKPDDSDYAPYQHDCIRGTCRSKSAREYGCGSTRDFAYRSKWHR
jgi:hypothetical protein